MSKEGNQTPTTFPMNQMIIDKGNLFTLNSDLLTTVSTDIRSLNARIVSFDQKLVFAKDQSQIDLLLQDDTAWKAYDV